MYRRILISIGNKLTNASGNLCMPKKTFCHHRLVSKAPSAPIFSMHRHFCSQNLEKVDFEDVKRLTKDKNIFIIDVREPQELADLGEIPNSINIPLGDVENVLKNCSDETFLQKYGRNKPKPDSCIIFSCMRGKRSENAQIAAQKLGFKNVKNYSGGWVDWEEQIKR